MIKISGEIVDDSVVKKRLRMLSIGIFKTVNEVNLTYIKISQGVYQT